MNKTLKYIAFTTMIFGLAACQTNYIGTPSSNVNVAKSQFDGAWLDDNGILSTFNNGKFETKTTDTNTLLAVGSYKLNSPTTALIEIKSLVTVNVNNVNCAIATPNQMNCTSSSGNQFSLYRKLNVS